MCKISNWPGEGIATAVDIEVTLRCLWSPQVILALAVISLDHVMRYHRSFKTSDHRSLAIIRLPPKEAWIFLHALHNSHPRRTLCWWCSWVSPSFCVRPSHVWVCPARTMGRTRTYIPALSPSERRVPHPLGGRVTNPLQDLRWQCQTSGVSTGLKSIPLYVSVHAIPFVCRRVCERQPHWCYPAGRRATTDGRIVSWRAPAPHVCACVGRACRDNTCRLSGALGHTYLGQRCNRFLSQNRRTVKDRQNQLNQLSATMKQSRKLTSRLYRYVCGGNRANEQTEKYPCIYGMGCIFPARWLGTHQAPPIPPPSLSLSLSVLLAAGTGIGGWWAETPGANTWAPEVGF